MESEEPENVLTHSLDTALRPESWEEYTGQEIIKKNLRILIQAAQERGQMPEHILLHGPAGLGKTTLAHVIGLSLKTPVQAISAVSVERTGDIVSIASTLQQGGVLFIDEIHRLHKGIEEVLYPIMESGSVTIMVGKGVSARSVEINLPPLLVVAATTQIGKISSPLRSRFSGGIFRLEPYTHEELQAVVRRSGQLLGMEVNKSVASAIAKRSRSNPRIANYLLKRVRDYNQVHKTDLTVESVDNALSNRSIDKFGLTVEDRRLLSVIQEMFNGGPVGVQALSSVLSEDVQTIEEVYEPFLIQIGFLKRTPRGRSISKKGFEYLSCSEE